MLPHSTHKPSDVHKRIEVPASLDGRGKFAFVDYAFAYRHAAWLAEGPNLLLYVIDYSGIDLSAALDFHHIHGIIGLDKQIYLDSALPGLQKRSRCAYLCATKMECVLEVKDMVQYNPMIVCQFFSSGICSNSNLPSLISSMFGSTYFK